MLGTCTAPAVCMKGREDGAKVCRAWRVRDQREPERQDSWRVSGSRLRCAASASASHASLSVCCTSSISFFALSNLPARSRQSMRGAHQPAQLAMSSVLALTSPQQSSSGLSQPSIHLSTTHSRHSTKHKEKRSVARRVEAGQMCRLLACESLFSEAHHLILPH